MGFYSFYKIIKDIIRTIFGNRVFRLVLIVCVCHFLLCFFNKVQASYVSDINGYFDNTTILTNNQNSVTLNNISVSIPSSFYENNAFFIKPYFAGGNITRFYVYYTAGDLKFSFDDNKFYATDTIYRSYTNVVSNSVNFNNFDSTSSYSGSSGANALFNNTDSYNCALYGQLYDYSNQQLIIGSSNNEISYNNNPITFTYNNTTYSNDTFNISEYKYFFIGTNKDEDFFTIYQSKGIINFTIVDEYLRTTNVSESNDIYYYSVPLEDFNTYNFNNYAYGLHFTSDMTGRLYEGTTHYILSNYNVSIDNYVFNKNSNIYVTINPYFVPGDTELQALNWSNLYVYPEDFDINNNSLYVHCLEVSRTVVGTGSEDPISYYYNDKVIKLVKNDRYWEQFLDSDIYYFSIPFSKFVFKPEKAYFLVLTNNSKAITSSLGKVNENFYNDIYQIVEINSSNLITIDDVINNNIENFGDDVTFIGRTIEESLSIGSESNKQLSEETNTNIDTNLNFNNQNSGLNNLNNGFFSRLTNLVRNLLNYNLSDDTVINIPYPHSNKNLELHSNIIYNNLSSTFQTLINSFWFFVFGFYMWRFINKIYIAVSTGHILDTFSSNGEAITNDML